MVKNLPIGDSRDAGSILGLGRSLGVGNGNLLQYSCLGNSMDRQAWWATVHGVTKSQTHTQPRNESIDPGNHHQWLLIPQKRARANPYVPPSGTTHHLLRHIATQKKNPKFEQTYRYVNLEIITRKIKQHRSAISKIQSTNRKK